MSNEYEGEKGEKHWEGKECSYKLMHDQSNATKVAENNLKKNL